MEIPHHLVADLLQVLDRAHQLTLSLIAVRRDFALGDAV